MKKITEIYQSEDDFAETLSTAEENASTEWEINFVSDLSNRYSEFGPNTRLTGNQKAALDKLVNRE